MTDWHDLVVSATVGTASRPVDLTATPAAVLDTVAAGADPAGSLLDAAVAFTVARRAGRRTATGVVPEPPADDPRPPLSPMGADLVRAVLVDRELDLARLALADVAVAGRRLPDQLVPVALDLATRHAALRTPVTAASGPVAPWLAARNPVWRWAIDGATAVARQFDAVLWETGTAAERVAQLRVLRSADPDAASALLAESWRGTAPDERTGLLAVLGPNPRPADEPLLEATLDDRRAATRQLAATLLGRLDGSAFRRRAVERASGLFSLERRTLRRFLAVADPPPFDAAARRDGLQELPAAPGVLGANATVGLGPVAARVRQLVAAAPLATWTELGMTPRDLVGLPVTRFDDEVVTGWVAAAVRERDVAWAEALLERRASTAPVRQTWSELVAVLPPERRTEVVVEALRTAPPHATEGIVTGLPVPWDDRVAQAFLRWFRRIGGTPPGRELLPALAAAGRGLAPTRDHAELLRQFVDAAPDGAVWPRAARQAADTLDLRRRLSEELR